MKVEIKCTISGRGASVQPAKILAKTGLTFRGRILYNEKRAEPKSSAERLRQ